MLKFYLTTVIIWMIIIYSMCILFEKQIKEKGWLKNVLATSKLKAFILLFCMSSIPVIRLFAAISIFMMACLTPEEVEEMKESDK